MKLLLIGWDGIDWGALRPMLEQGLMPCLQQFLSDAVSGELQPVRPWESATLWTSIVTGQRATVHGVLSGVEVAPCRTQIRPTARSTCAVPAIWSLFSAAGIRTHALGWPASHPAEEINGVAVSDLFADFGEAGSVNPQRLNDTLHNLRMLPTEIDAASLLTLLPRAAELNPLSDQRLFLVAQFLASTASLHAAATWAMEHDPWDFAAVRYDGLARLIRVFGPAHAAVQRAAPDTRDEDAERFANLVPNAFRFFDMLFRRLLELAEPDASVILVSECGIAAPPASRSASPSRPSPGIFIAKGPAFKPCRELDVASVCDVAPTILQIFRLRSDAPSHGRALNQVLTSAPTGSVDAPARSEDHQALSVEHQASSIQQQSSATTDDESVAHLIALGYREPPDEFLRIAIERVEQAHLWRLAEAWFDCRQYQQAVKVLEQLVRSEPGSKIYRSVLAEAYFRAGDFEACGREIAALQERGLETSLGELGLAAIASLDGRTTEALDHLQRAEAMPAASAAELDLMGQLYLRLRRWEDAARAFDAALARDPERATAHEGRATTYLFAQDPSNAERHARNAVRLNPDSCEAHFLLGLALDQSDRTQPAIEAFRDVLQLDPRGSAAAHRQLARVFERRRDHALAFHHRAMADRCGSRARQPRSDSDRLGHGLDFDPFRDDWLQLRDTVPL